MEFWGLVISSLLLAILITTWRGLRRLAAINSAAADIGVMQAGQLIEALDEANRTLDDMHTELQKIEARLLTLEIYADKHSPTFDLDD